ncbi:hypothetical protein [Methyloceanibacter superfactus]|jgi:hypothetical protein|uniref:hypothetical protein n=1 Tax=Methyloceanibacter superfactus TaxID=1774969 RepID=UPI00114CF1FA|nr:hypothetical protein [Methyloceanibacter superfactus]
MRLTPPTRYVFFSSVVLAVAALVLYVLGLFQVIDGAAHFAFWVAFVAWLAMTAGVAAKGV